MDNLTGISSGQQVQTASTNIHEKAKEPKVTEQNLVKQVEETSKMADNSEDTKIDSKKDVENLVKKLNDAMEPMNTSLKFGIDSDDVYFVSVIDQKTHDVIRRFPAEKAQNLLPKMQEVSGTLFDFKG